MSFIKQEVKLFSNQKYNVSKLVHRRKALLCDKCGNGKTLSVLYAFSLLKQRSLLNNLFVFTPLSAYRKEVWKQDVQKFTSLKCIDLEVLQQRVNNFPGKLESYLKEFDVIYAKHSHVRQISSFIERICEHPKVMVSIDECFVGDTLIYVKRYGSNRVVSMTIQSIVESNKKYSALTVGTDGRLTFKPIIGKFYNGKREVYKVLLKTSSGIRSVHCTGNHLFQTALGWSEAKSLSCGDLVKNVVATYSGSHGFSTKETSFAKVLSVQKTDFVKKVYDIEVEETHNYFANGFNVHNCHAFKNAKSSLTISMRMAIRSAYGMWLLTATPLSKNLEDSFNIINFLSPFYLGTFQQFKDRYCNVEKKVIGKFSNGVLKKVDVITGVRNEEEFSKKLEPLVIQGESTFHPNFHFIDYELTPYEASIYRRIAAGIDLDSALTPEEWLKKALTTEEVDTHHIKDVSRYSSRFLYLQSAADGILNEDGTQTRKGSTKVNKLIDLIKEIIAKKQSALIYFDYYASLEVVRDTINSLHLPLRLLESTGSSVLDPTAVTEAKAKRIPHVILCTRASSESASYYYFNHVIFFQIPTVANTIVQMAGRILRKNTLFPEDLNLYYFRSESIDLYKLLLVSVKSYQMELVSGEECSIPPDYKHLATKAKLIEKQKKLLLWNLK